MLSPEPAGLPGFLPSLGSESVAMVGWGETETCLTSLGWLVTPWVFSSSFAS